MPAGKPSAASDEQLRNVVRFATQRVLCDNARWFDEAASHAHAGTWSVLRYQELPPDSPERFEYYHKKLKFGAKGASGPKLRFTCLKDTPGKKPDLTEAVSLCNIETDLRICANCCKVKAKMSSCSRCCHVFYCSVPCQNAAWKEHKPFCDYVTGVTLKKGRRPTSSVVDPHVYLRGVMRPDRPRLCRFWLAGLASALDAAETFDAIFALRALVAFLWRYTWAGVPEPLRLRFLTALRHLRPVAYAKCDAARCAAQRGGGGADRALVFATMSLTSVHAVWWTLRDDEAFVEWRRGKGDAAAPPADLKPDESFPESMMRSFVVAIVLDQDASQWLPEHEDLDPRVAKLAVCTTLRGGGLAASAFGLVCCREAVTTFLERLLATRRPDDAAYREFEKHTLVTYAAGWLDVHRRFLPPSAPPARTDPRHLVIWDRGRFKCQSNTLPGEQAAAEALAELRAAGAKAVPLLRGEIPGVDQRRFGRSHNELLLEDSLASAEAAWEARRQWLQDAGGVFALLTACQPGVLVQPAGYADLVL